KCRGLDHEAIIRDPDNQIWLGLTPALIKAIRRFTPVQDRDALLLYIMKKSPLMRIRGHGSYVTFEFSSDGEYKPLDAIRKWAKKNAGPATVLNIVNFVSGHFTAISVLPHQLKKVVSLRAQQ
ncbi:MAG: hypothetical protein WCI95_13470, partial [bacterium]